MSDHPPASDAPAPSDASLWLNVAGYLVLILLFVVIAGIAYLPNRPAPLDTERAAFRAAARQKVYANAAEADRYGWIDREKGVVRLPVERAMELTVRELSSAPAPAPAGR